MEGDSSISTRLKRPSNCSERLRTKRGQLPAPGISSLSAASIWQPLHRPRLNVSSRRKNAANSSRARALNSTDLAQPSPAPSTSPRSEEHTSELQSREKLVCRLLLDKKHNR